MKAVFFDRDGTLLVARSEFVLLPDEVELFPDAAAAVARLRAAGWRVFVATNQSCVARGLITEARLRDVHAKFESLLAKAGAKVDGIYWCPHLDNGCDCRKPLPGLLTRAARDHGLALRESVVVGDAVRDLEAGRAAGTRTVFLKRGDVGVPPALADFVAPSLTDAARWILS